MTSQMRQSERISTISDCLVLCSLVSFSKNCHVSEVVPPITAHNWTNYWHICALEEFLILDHSYLLWRYYVIALCAYRYGHALAITPTGCLYLSRI